MAGQPTNNEQGTLVADSADAPDAGRSLSDLWTPDAQATTLPQLGDLARLLLDRGVIDKEQMSAGQKIAQQAPGTTLAEVFIEMGVDEAAIQQVVAQISRLEFESIDPDSVQIKQIDRLGHDFCRSHGVMPLRLAGQRLVLGVVSPDDLPIIDEVRHKLGMAVKPVVVSRADIAAALEALKQDDVEEQEQGEAFNDIIAGIEEDDVEVVETKQEEVDLEKMAGESPVIRFVNYLIFNAVKEGASDIHIEPQEKKLLIRFRIDGLMFEMMNPPLHMHPAIVSRLKIMSNLDIAERRLPQDGRIRAMVHGRKLDLRLSTLPLAQGEKCVLRILDTRAIQVPLEELGMNEDVLLMWKHQISQPHGIILVTGPTGSGKTTTLYASLGQMDRARLNISTVEDPVEYHLSGINQCQTYDKIGMTFAAALRSLLRQDPDVVMVGEIRDAETGRIAIQASLTGHLVLSTLHTNDAPSSITRLINIGVEPYLIGSAVNACLAQRLVRRICDSCKTPMKPNEQMAEHLMMHGLSANELWHGPGCDKCRQTGYTGRLGLYEILILDDHLRDLIACNPNVTEFRRICVERGMATLRLDGFKKVALGQTTVDEVMRVTESTI